MNTDIKTISNLTTGLRATTDSRDVADKTTASATDKPAQVAAGEQVNLTGRAQLLQKLETELAQFPAADNSRVEAIKQAVAAGEYQVDADAVAEGMLRMEATSDPAGD